MHGAARENGPRRIHLLNVHAVRPIECDQRPHGGDSRGRFRLQSYKPQRVLPRKPDGELLLEVLVHWAPVDYAFCEYVSALEWHWRKVLVYGKFEDPLGHLGRLVNFKQRSLDSGIEFRTTAYHPRGNGDRLWCQCSDQHLLRKRRILQLLVLVYQLFDHRRPGLRLQHDRLPCCTGARWREESIDYAIVYAQLSTLDEPFINISAI
mmetsp:Transcript_242/g.586  ORF Transcript_242/g.586 Transcript_242/m.586 type:complete len:207 (+) Transcript_242:795-1415(+)